jgi:hypothetical protein
VFQLKHIAVHSLVVLTYRDNVVCVSSQITRLNTLRPEEAERKETRWPVNLLRGIATALGASPQTLPITE